MPVVDVKLTSKRLAQPQANPAALTSIDDTLLNEGVLAYVDSLGMTYSLKPSSTETVNGYTVIATNSGTGRWIYIGERLFSAASEVEMLALPAKCGDLVVRTDLDDSVYAHNESNTGTIADWTLVNSNEIDHHTIQVKSSSNTLNAGVPVKVVGIDTDNVTPIVDLITSSNNDRCVGIVMSTIAPNSPGELIEEGWIGNILIGGFITTSKKVYVQSDGTLNFRPTGICVGVVIGSAISPNHYAMWVNTLSNYGYGDLPGTYTTQTSSFTVTTDMQNQVVPVSMSNGTQVITVNGSGPTALPAGFSTYLANTQSISNPVKIVGAGGMVLGEGSDVLEIGQTIQLIVYSSTRALLLKSKSKLISEDQVTGFTITNAEYGVLVECVDNDATWTLPLQSSLIPLFYTYLRNDTDTALTINRTGSNTIEGQTSYIIPPRSTILVYAEGGGDWKILSSFFLSVPFENFVVKTGDFAITEDLIGKTIICDTRSNPITCTLNQITETGFPFNLIVYGLYLVNFVPFSSVVQITGQPSLYPDQGARISTIPNFEPGILYTWSITSQNENGSTQLIKVVLDSAIATVPAIVAYNITDTSDVPRVSVFTDPDNQFPVGLLTVAGLANDTRYIYTKGLLDLSLSSATVGDLLYAQSDSSIDIFRSPFVVGGVTQSLGGINYRCYVDFITNRWQRFLFNISKSNGDTLALDVMGKLVLIAGPATITMSQHLGLGNNFSTTIKNTSTSGTVTVNAFSGDTINGVAAYVIPVNSAVTIYCDGTSDLKAIGSFLDTNGPHGVDVTGIFDATISNAASVTQIESGTNQNNMRVFIFFRAQLNRVSGRIMLPSNIDKSSITYRLTWCTPSTDTTKVVVWSVDTIIRNNTDAEDTAYGTAVTVSGAPLATAKNTIISAESAAVFPAVPGGTPAANAELEIRISRNAGVGSDTLVDEAYLRKVEVFFKQIAGNTY